MGAIRPCSWMPLFLFLIPLLACGQEPPKGSQPATEQLDLYGDPLPPGALARLGSVRFRHAGAVHGVAFSPDGKVIAASSDGLSMVVLWDRASGRKLHQIPFPGRSMPPIHLHFSPDGKRLYGSTWYGRGGQLYAWDVKMGADARTIPDLPGGGRTLGYSPDGQELLLEGEAAVVRWDIEKGKERGRYPRPEGYLSTAALVGRQLLVPSFNGQAVAMWDAAQEKQLWSVPATRDRGYPGLPMVFSTDGKLFATETPPRVISLYESVTGKKVRQIRGDVEKIFWSLTFSPDARLIAGSSWDGSLRLWDLESGKERVKIAGLEGWTTEVFFAPDSRTFATGGPNNAHAVMLWETATGKRIDPFPGHASPLSSIAFSPDGQRVATCSSVRGDPVVRLWELQSGRLVRAIDTATKGGVYTVVFSPDGHILAAGSGFADKKVSLWDVRTGRLLHTLTGEVGNNSCLAFTPDGKRLAAAGSHFDRRGRREGSLSLWDVSSGKHIRTIDVPDGNIRGTVFTHDGRQVLAAGHGVHVYDADTGQASGAPLQAGSWIGGMALSADGRLLATANGDNQVRLWELATRRDIPVTNFRVDCYHVDLCGDGRTLLATGTKGGVLFDWPSGKVITGLATDPRFERVSFLSPDGRRVVTANSTESSVLVWDVSARSHQPLPRSARPSKADLRRWWADLADDSPAVAYRAVWDLVAAPEQALPFLAGCLRPSKAPEPARVARLIAELDSADFETREKASRELERLGGAVTGDLRKAAQLSPPPEQGRRLQRLLARTAGPEQWRTIRVVAVLEQIGGPQAERVLKGLAAGAPGACLTQEAREALGRLGRARR